MKKLLKSLAAIVLVTFTFISGAFAAPMSKCNDNGESFSCDLFEQDANGDLSEIGRLITLPRPGGTDPILILDQGGSLGDQTTWSDELIFSESGSQGFVRVVSVGCNVGPGNLSCFDLKVQSTVFESAASGVATVRSFGNTYLVHSEADIAQVPEPTSLALLGAVCLALGFDRRKAH